MKDDGKSMKLKEFVKRMQEECEEGSPNPKITFCTIGGVDLECLSIYVDEDDNKLVIDVGTPEESDTHNLTLLGK